MSIEISKLIDQAQNEYDQENYRQAADLLAEVYQEESSLQVNHSLVLALQKDQQFQLAKDYANDHINDYLQDTDLFTLYLDLLLATQNFVLAQQWVLQGPEDLDRETELGKIRAAENEAIANQGQTIAVIEKQFYHLSDEDWSGQQDRYQQGFHLPVASFTTGAKFLLVDPFATPLMRATLMADLQQLGEDGSTTYQWLDGNRYQVDFQATAPVFASKTFTDLVGALDDLVGQEDPVAYQALFDQLRLEAMLVFPRLSEGIPDPEAWVDVDLANFYQDQKPDEEPDQKQVHDLVQKAFIELAQQQL
ncbi:hypothetical protein [Fructobacillus ficulneus]|uniref:BS_ysoA related protein with TPR repeats n=1 Tax=Fructobacillus ficulneus TaxID=157463 RepID=A0A0K8MJ21_9LACO|nr:hypothetical protein [Fructobacillus ficulneus]GAP00562.1 BS_ysoA related protein with TPR repeats [Fructobacillus ficulneus]